ncbi:C4-dicarboxylate transporter DcuC [Photobacterium nomapromontoriensis]|uniref:C4-dicarboxylate transporter DcuC n=1 Tax=Photobacterium nomapromontoriensis TaxID=2910237 RepID=UPI003D10BD33
MLGVTIGLVVVFFVGRAILKGKYPQLVLFTAGIVMLTCSVAFNLGSFLPANAMATGNGYLDIVEFIRYMFSYRLAGLGLIIMVMVGFANYMTYIGANDAFVNIAIKPMGLIKNPYIMIFVAFVLAKVVSMVITSAAGLGVLCLALLGPPLIAYGLNPVAIGAVFATSGAASLVLVGASTMASAEASAMSILDYVFIYKLPAGVPTAIVIGLTHVFWQRYLDKKDGWIVADHVGDSFKLEVDIERPSTKVPKVYAILPFLPMVFVVLFSKYGLDGLSLHIASVMFLSVMIGMFCEVIRHRGNFDELANGMRVFLQAMGKSLGGIVSLVIAAGVFAEGFKAIGMLDSLVNLATMAGIGGVGMSILLVMITSVVAIIAGSNGASFYPLIEMVPNMAKMLNVPAVMLVLPMHQASTIARPLSPVAGVVVALAGILKVSPFELVKRSSVPCIIGLIAHHFFAFALSM